MSVLNPYLNFRSEAREAMEFYSSVFGGQLDVMTFDQFPDMGTAPEDGAKVMHSQLTTPDGFTLMASDTPSHMEYADHGGFAVSLSGDDEDRLTRWWQGLAEGAQITMALDTPPWGGKFGMLTDRYGIDWMVSVNAEPPAA
ncbi:VOC family protein [Microbacterium gorillae]|uniref:VOC family protein n=1 Tax=Microbacterium gorillae TaxID=1231063 RepID=UPI00058C39DD|nr:VOC family protein [Microbacterium gorillae]